MNIAISLCEHERSLALKWFSWVTELGPNQGHQLYLLPASGMEFTDVRLVAEQAFPGAVTILKDAEAVKSDWQADVPARSAAGPNSMLRTFAWYFYLNKLGPWLWLELDAIPLKAGWHDALEAEYVRGNKPFMGAHVVIEKVPEHMTGNGIYSHDTPALAPTLVQHTNWIDNGKEYELAFDIAGAKEVLPKAHFTNLIQHVFRHPGFKSHGEFNALIDPAAVVFHSNKDGSIFPFLQERAKSYLILHRKEGDAKCPSVAANQVTAEMPKDSVSIADASNGAAESSTPQSAPEAKDPKLSREALTRDAVAILKGLCTAPRYTNLVRKELRLQGVIK